MKNIIISSITSNDLKEEKYKAILPEYYNLKSLTENNLWHLNQNVFDHVVSVFEGLEDVLKLKFLSQNANTKAGNYLNLKVSQHSRKELLMVATILHDIAKTETLISNFSGVTSCPGHEIIGSFMVRNFLSRFGLDKIEGERVEKIVRYHGFISDMLTLIIANKNKNKYITLFKSIVGDIYIELLLLMYADMEGCDLKKSAPQEFYAREKLITGFLNNIVF